MTVEAAARALGAPLYSRSAGQSPECWITRRADGSDPGTAYLVANGQIRRIDIIAAKAGQTTVRSGPGISIGSRERTVREIYRARLQVLPHPYSGPDGGHYLVLESPDRQSGMIFETFDGQVIQIRAGRRPELDYVEGCS